MLKKKNSGVITISDFFASAFLRTGFMVVIAGFLGVAGRLMAPKVFTNSGLLLVTMIGSIAVIFGLNWVINSSLAQGDLQKLGMFSYLSVAFLGLFTGVITAVYHVDLIAKALLTTAIVFGITATYGYLTKKDMSSLSTVLNILLFTCLGLSIVGFIVSFFNRSLAVWFFSIHSMVSIVFNIVFLVFFIDMNKKIYQAHKHNAHQLQLMNVYASYIIFNRILDLFLNILYLLSRHDQKRD
jgi:FtsH-binding integral membrane protein